MPINVPYTRVVVSGTMPGGEVFACSWAQLTAGASAQASADAIAADSTFTALMTALRNVNNGGFSLARLTVYRYLANQTAASDIGIVALTGAGTSTSNKPNQIALVTTLRTATNTGRGRGRIFWPATGQDMSTNGLASNTGVQALNTAFGNYANGKGVYVVSNAAGVAYIVTRVTTDNRFDTIRARAAKVGGVTTNSANVTGP